MTWCTPLLSWLLFRKPPWEPLLPTVKMVAAASASVFRPGGAKGEEGPGPPGVRGRGKVARTPGDLRLATPLQFPSERPLNDLVLKENLFLAS